MARIRIIAGDLKGRFIEVPDSDSTRPTANRVREAVMSSIFSLKGVLDGLHVLDAFAGSGAMGFEAISRGASDVVFTDVNASACKTIERNAESLGVSRDDAIVKRRDALSSGLPAGRYPYDVVFLDPPYRDSHSDVVGLLLDARKAGFLSDDCLVVYEHDGDLDLTCDELEVVSEKAYGKTMVSYIRLGNLLT